MEHTEKTICKICNGKGGWRKPKEMPLDDPWHDCLFCNGFGFHDAFENDEKEYASFILKYNKYRKDISQALEELGELKAFYTENKGETFHLHFVPYDREIWVDAIKSILKFQHFNEKLTIKTRQEFFYLGYGNSYGYYWHVELAPKELSDLDGFLEAVDAYVKG